MLNKETLARLRRLSQSSVERHKPRTTKSEFQRRLFVDRPIDSSSIRSGIEIQNDSGAFLLIRQPLGELWPESESFLKKWQARRTQVNFESMGDDYREFCRWFPEQAVFLDLETCGFAGATVFLAGLLHTVDGMLMLSQFWARNYAEEKSLLLALKDELRHQQVLVTFNGKSFDWPQVRDRCVLHTGSIETGLPELVHLDLLHISRRRWKNVLPNCKLQTLEKFICGRQRRGDIPGYEIPEVYQGYVQTGDCRYVDRVLHHNALDLVTLFQLALIVGMDQPAE